MSLTIKQNGKNVEPSHVLAKKAATKTLSPQELYRQKRSASAPATVGPKEQVIKIDPSVKRGGTIGATLGKKKRKSSFTSSTGSMTAGRTRRSR